jgi:hypothetical protein
VYEMVGGSTPEALALAREGHETRAVRVRVRVHVHVHAHGPQGTMPDWSPLHNPRS